MKEACDRHNLSYDINEGDGAFYGPKIDIKVKDAIGRTWQCSTVQVDFNLPERFELTYRTAENTEERPWMLHRAIFGSIERFFGILIEHYAGALPLCFLPFKLLCFLWQIAMWMHARRLRQRLLLLVVVLRCIPKMNLMRVKLQKAQAEKIPYMGVIGDKELEQGGVSIRERHEGDLGVWSEDKLLEVIREAALD